MDSVALPGVPGNVRFLYNLFKEVLGADPDAVEDCFPSPRKP